MRATGIAALILVIGTAVAAATVAEGQGEVTGSAGTGTATTTVVTASPTSGAPESSGPLQAPSGERTHPRLQPTIGRRHTRFTLTFTLRDAPGHQGALAVDYRVHVAPPVGTRASCTPAEPPTIDTGRAGAMEQVPLRPPAQGWCKGSHRVTVFLERAPYCPPPVEGQTPTPCPEFATQELDTGDASFTVRPRVHHRS
ncbi:MAG: hypothetical protein QOI84_1592 [Solirubrobacterales bacterium]|jgi:hypothetical protein|nr:hypothetical protein [Solirubrobacterales bacterium]